MLVLFQLFTFLYAKLFGALDGKSRVCRTGGTVRDVGVPCTGLAVLAMYQHMRVSPSPLEENGDVWCDESDWKMDISHTTRSRCRRFIFRCLFSAIT